MQVCTYRILEFARSEIERNGLEIAIVVRFDDMQENHLRIFQLDGWERMIKGKVAKLVPSVQDMLYQYRQYSRRPDWESSELFRELDMRSIGVLRTGLKGGTAILPPMEEIDTELDMNQDSKHISSRCFQALITALINHPAPELAISEDDQLPTYNF